MGVDLDLGQAELVGQGRRSKVKVKFLARSIRSYLNFLTFIAILLMHLRGLNPKIPTGFSLGYDSPIPVVLPAIGSFQIHLRPWVAFHFAQHNKMQNFINPPDSLTWGYWEIWAKK